MGVIVLLSKWVGVFVLIGLLLSIIRLFLFLMVKGVLVCVNVVGISFVGMNCLYIILVLSNIDNDFKLDRNFWCVIW